MSIGNCQEDSGNVEGGLEAKKISSWSSKLKISRNKFVPDMAKPTKLRSVKKAIGKCLRKITSGIGRIRCKRPDSEEMFSSWRSGLQRRLDRRRSATHRIGRACSKLLRSVTIPFSWRSVQQISAHCNGRAVGNNGRTYGERSSGTRNRWLPVHTDIEESILTEAAAYEDITDSEVLVHDDGVLWVL
jgi:hypothetical protein